MSGAAESLRRLIAPQGPIPVSRFMAEAMAHPEHGYYVRGEPIGALGDFVTAPEISQMFGELIGLWLVDLWRRVGAPAPVRLVELGPGRGTLLADALRAARCGPSDKRRNEPQRPIWATEGRVLLRRGRVALGYRRPTSPSQARLATAQNNPGQTFPYGRIML